MRKKEMETAKPESKKWDSLISSDSLPEMQELEEEYKKIIEDIEQEEEREKPKKERKKKEIIQEDEEEIGIQAEAIENWIALPFDIYFTRNDKPILTRIERLALSQQTAKVLNKYIPLISERWKEEIGLAVCLATIFASRMKPPEIKKEEKKEEIKGSNEQLQQ